MAKPRGFIRGQEATPDACIPTRCPFTGAIVAWVAVVLGAEGRLNTGLALFEGWGNWGVALRMMTPFLCFSASRAERLVFLADPELAPYAKREVLACFPGFVSNRWRHAGGLCRGAGGLDATRELEPQTAAEKHRVPRGI